jgi:hypothetical protein
MTRPGWLIESGVYGPEVEPLGAEVRRQGMDCRFVSYRDIVKGPPPLPPGACAIVYGTYPTVRHAMLHRGWHPGGWCNPDTLDCAAYYPHFEKYLLNRNRLILTGIAAIRSKDALFTRFGWERRVFARPTSVHKLFVGRVIAEEDFETALAPTRYDSETTVVIAEPREIDREWRLIVAGDEVIAASQYAESGVKSVSPQCPEEVLAFARRILAEVCWRPDDLFMLDVAEADEKLYLVEINSFSCSWLYGCDFSRVIEIASRTAGRAWERANGG